MKDKIGQFCTKSIAMILSICMIVGCFPMVAFASDFKKSNVSTKDEKPLVLSFGDSMTNGYGQEGYEGPNGEQVNGFRQNDITTTYPYYLAEYIAKQNPNFTSGDDIRKYVDWEALAISCMRPEDMNFLLRFKFEDKHWQEVIEAFENEGCSKDKWIGNEGPTNGFFKTNFPGMSLQEVWEETFVDENGDVIGDFFTWNEFVNGRFKDYGEVTKTENYKEVPYNWYDEPTVSYAKFYQNMVKAGDVFALGIGDAAFGVILLQNLMGVFNIYGFQYNGYFDIDGLIERRMPGNLKEVTKTLLTKLEEAATEKLPSTLGDKAGTVIDVLVFTVLSFMISYKDFLLAVDELNDKASIDVVMLGLMNTTKDIVLQLPGMDAFNMEEVLDEVFAILSEYELYMPSLLQLEGKLSEMNFYYAPSPSIGIELLCDDMADLSKLKTDGYVIVRDRMVEDIKNTVFPMMQDAIDDALANVELVPENIRIKNSNIEKKAVDVIKPYEELRAAFENWRNDGYEGPFDPSLSGTNAVAGNMSNVLAAGIYLAFEKAISKSAGSGIIIDESLIDALISGDLSSMLAPVEDALDMETLSQNVSAAVAAYLLAKLNETEEIAQANSLEIVAGIDKAIEAINTLSFMSSIKSQLSNLVSLYESLKISPIVPAGDYWYKPLAEFPAKLTASVDIINNFLDNYNKLNNDEKTENNVNDVIYNNYFALNTLFGPGSSYTDSFAQLKDCPYVPVDDRFLDSGAIEVINMLNGLGAFTETAGNMVEAIGTIQGSPEFQFVSIFSLINGLSDSLGNALSSDDEAMAPLRSLFSLFARFLIGNGIGSHPNNDGHQALFNSVIEVYPNKPIIESLKDSLIDKGLMLGLINDDNKLIYRENLGKLLDLFFDFSKKTEEEAIEYVSYLVNAWLSENGDKILPAIRAYAIEKGYVNADTINALDAKIGAVISAVKTGNSADIFASVTDLVKYLFTLYKENEELVDNAKSFASDFIDLIAKVLIPRNIKSIDNYVSIGASNVNGYGLEGYFQLDNEADYKKIAYDYKVKSKCNVLGYLQAPEKSYPVLLQKALSTLQGNEVNLTQLAISSMRAEELRILLDDSYMGDSYSAWRFTGKNNWFDIADGVSDGDISELRRSYQESIKNADLITVDIGANNFGVYLSQQLSTNFALDKDISLIDPNMGYMYNNAKAAVEEALAPYKEYIDISSYSGLIDSIVYALVGFCYNFNKSIEKIYELNPDATVVVVGIQNLLEGLKANVYGFELPLGDVIGAIIDLANMYIQYGTIYAVKYLYANPAGSEGRVEFFLDEIAAYNGDVNSLSQDMINCFNIFDGNPGVRYNKGVHIQFQVLKAIAAKSNPILEEAFKDPEFEYTEEVYNQTMAVFAELLVNSETKDLASAAITAAYSVYASMLKTAAVVDVVDYSVLGNPDVEAILSEGIANELVKAVDFASKGKSYTFDETEFYNGLSNVSGISVDTLKGAAALAVRVSLGNSFFSHPNENGHKTIADSILQALNGTTVVDNFYITVLGLAEKYKTELPKYIKDYVLSMGVVNEAEYDAYLAELCELLVSFGHSEVLALLKGEIGLYEAYGKEIEEVKESLKALLKGNPEKVISLLNAVIDNIPFVSAQAKEELKGYIAEYEKQYLALYAEYGKYLDKQYLESYAKALANEFVSKLCLELDHSLNLEPGESLAMVFGIISELEAGAKITDIVNGYIDQITNYVVKEGKEQEAKLLAAIRKFLADNNISDEDLAVFDAYSKEVYDAINNAAPAVKEALSKAFAFVYEIVSDENLDFVRLANYLVEECNASAAKIYDLILNAKKDIKDQSVVFYAGMVKAILAELSKLGLDSCSVVTYAKSMLDGLCENLQTPQFVKETLEKIEESVLSMLKPDIDKILYQIESYLRDNGASKLELAKYIAVKDKLLACLDQDKNNAKELLYDLFELTVQIIKEDQIEALGLIEYIQKSGVEFTNEVKDQLYALTKTLYTTATQDALRIIDYVVDELYKGFNDSTKIHYVVDKVLTMLTKKEGTLDSIEECISKISSYVSDKNFVQNLVNDIKELTVNYGPEYLEKVFEYALAKGILPKEAKELTDDVVELTKALRAGNEDYVEVLSFALVNRLSVYVIAAVNEFRDTHTYADVENAIFNAAKTIAEVESDPETLVKMLATIIKESYMYYGKEGLDFVVNFLADYVPEFAKAKFNEAVIVVYEKLEKSEEGFEEAFYAKFLELSGLNEENLTVIAGILDGIKDVAYYIASLYEAGIPQNIRSKVMAEIAKLPIAEVMALLKGEATIMDIYGDEILAVKEMIQNYILSEGLKAANYLKGVVSEAKLISENVKAMICGYIDEYVKAYNEAINIFGTITNKEFINEKAKELADKLTACLYDELSKYGINAVEYIAIAKTIVSELKDLDPKAVLDEHLDKLAAYVLEELTKEQEKLINVIRAHIASKLSPVCEEIREYNELANSLLEAIGKDAKHAKAQAKAFVAYLYNLAEEGKLNAEELLSNLRACGISKALEIQNEVLAIKEILQTKVETQITKVLSAVFEEFAKFGIAKDEATEMITQFISKISKLIQGSSGIKDILDEITLGVRTIVIENGASFLDAVESYLVVTIGISNEQIAKYKMISDAILDALNNNKDSLLDLCKEFVSYLYELSSMVHFDFNGLTAWLEGLGFNFEDELKAKFTKLACQVIANVKLEALSIYQELLDTAKAHGVDVETIVGIINSVIGDINNCVSSFDLANMYLGKIAELLVDQVASTKENVLNMICAYLEKYCQIAKSELDILKDLAEKLIVAVSNQADEAKDISQQIVAYIYQLVELGKLDAMNLISYLEKEGLELSEEVTSLVQAAIACLESNVIGALKELTNNVLVKFDQIKDSSKLLANIINEMIVSIKQGKDVKDIIQDAIADITKDIKAIVLETGSLYLEKINSLLLEKGLIVKAEADKLKALTDELVKAVMTNAKNAEALCKEYVTCVYNSLTYSRALVLSLIENVKLEAIAYLSESEKEAISLIAALKQKVNELSSQVNDKLSEISLEISLRLAFAQFTFIECEELNYVVIGSNTVRANGLERTEKAYYDLFAEKYEAESIDVISKANLTPWEVADMIIENASTIAKANLITYQFDLESFIYAYLAQNIEWADHIDANTLRIIDLVMDSLEKVLEDDWTSYMTLDAKEFEEKLYDEVLGLWTTKMPELVNEFVKLGREQVVEILEKGITLVRMTLAQAEQQKLELFKAASKSTREALYRMVRKTLYITTAYAIETVKVVETIKAINPDAELVIIGMYNQLEGISLKNGEDTIEIGSYINYLVDALNMTYLAYAAYREDITFIDIAETSCDGLNLVVDLENLDPLALISSLLNLTTNISANANGHKYIYEQLLANVLVDKQGSDEPEPEVVLGDVNEDGYIDSIDAMLVLRYDAQLIDIKDINALNADVNDDGFIDSIDAMLILRYDAQLIDSFSSSN